MKKKINKNPFKQMKQFNRPLNKKISLHPLILTSQKLIILWLQDSHLRSILSS